ncbi:2-phosphosulfolactate phosphatase [Carboxydochorda subterranea]|uniref:Probable 2-phosphosulfolactate phosphatase n=1 Tax=Carboxydichorda subterranea TaxID=3109565 RepID=A0ABZ1C1B7_9FIRM|nr:2-phosphosulfolactate phosphatase [Limnochorda sp. L945t]WRP18630.1 2-phosphosulfolactate phosphatase [Limnochorda sp. L945t]
MASAVEIRRARLLEGARSAEGVVVIIDVLRAFSVAAYAAALGARPLVAVAHRDQALALRERHPQAVLSGEAGGWPLPGFDFGNSPGELLRAVARGRSLRGRPFIQRTSSGTQGVTLATRARHVFAASFVNAPATASAIRKLRPDVVTLVAMGVLGDVPAEEDEMCAEALETLLRGAEWSPHRLAGLAAGPRVGGILRGELPYLPAWDVGLCLAYGLFPFALRARRAGDAVFLRPVWV